MARIRTIKPEFPQSESMGRVSRDARLLFVLLWTICDDAGRARGNSRMLASLLFPYDDDAPKLCARWLDELAKENCVTLYEVNDDKYVEIANWLKHQKIDKPTASKLPGPREGSRILSKPRECSSEDLGPRTRTKDHSVASQRAPEAPGTPLDLKRELWARGIPFLQKAGGLNERSARNLLGKWRRDHGDVEVINALAAAEGAAASEPAAYVQRVLNGKEKANGSGQHGKTAHPLGVFGQLADDARAAAVGPGWPSGDD